MVELNREKQVTKVPCGLCGRLFDPGELHYDSGTRKWLCPDCRAELQSCGCSDE